MEPSARTILIVDDHPIVRRGLAALIEAEADLAVHDTVATCQEALAAIGAREPGLAIVDLVLADGDGLDLIKTIRTRHPGVRSLVLSMHDEAAYAERALRAGARGYVSKQGLDDAVLVAIRCVLGGEMYMSDALARLLAGKYAGGGTLDSGSILDRLSNRELQVFRLIGEGRSTRQVAESLRRSVKTVESHLEHIKNKLAIGSAAELARCAARWVDTGRIG